ncbi:MAG: beta strand repeat-containing protein, partial [Candidatus Nanopelagicaceae bacterium]
LIQYNENAIDSAPSVTRVGHNLVGWGVVDTEAVSPILVTDTKTLYAIWEPIQYQITYDANGGADDSVTTRAYDVDIIATAPTVTRTGYSFVAWTDETGTVINLWKATEARTVYASWQINSYTITLTTNAGGTVSPNTSTTLLYNETVTYNFAPAAEKQIQRILVNGVDIGSKPSSYTFGSVDQNFTLEVYFETVTYPVYFDPNGGTGGGEVQVYKNTDALDSVPATSRAGYTFLGWSLDGTYILEELQITTQGETVTALWQINSYPITFDVNGGSGSSVTLSLQFGVDALTSGSIPTTLREGYNFLGWGTDSTIALGTYTVTETKTLYAVWTPITFPVTFAGNGGTDETGTSSFLQEIEYDDDAIGAAPSLTRVGHTFRGWSFDGTNIVSSFTVRETATLTALWLADTFTITLVQSTGGSLAATIGGAIDYGSSETVTITAASGYYLLDVLVNGVSIGPVTETVFASVTEDETVTAIFKKEDLVITASAVGPGSISPSGQVALSATIATPASETFTFEAEPGYHLETVTVGGVIVPVTNNSYTITNLRDDTTIVAYFVIDTFAIYASASVGGTISPSETVSVNSGSNQRFTITPAPGYSTWDIYVDEFLEDSNRTSYTFFNVQQNQTIRVEFIINNYTITTSVSGSGGTVSPLGSRQLDYGVTDTITFIPDVGYHVKNVTVGGVSIGAVTEYVIESVTANLAIVATFEIDTYTISYDLQGGTLVSGNAETVVVYNTEVIALAPTVARDGFTLAGWSVDSPTLINSLLATGDSTIVAVWVSNVTLVGVDDITTTEGRGETRAITAVGGYGNNQFTLSGVNAGLGITIDAQTGVLTIPASLPAATYYETITVTDSQSISSTETIVITVNPPVSLTGASTLITTRGLESSTAFSGSNGTDQITYSISGGVAGITVTAQGLVVVDSSTAAGTYSVVVTATDSLGMTDTKSMVITVNPEISIAGQSLLFTTVGRALDSPQYTTSGGTGAVTLSITNSTTGITLSGQGVIQLDSNLAVGTYFETITATDSLGVIDTLVVTITVNQSMTIIGPSTVQSTEGIAYESGVGETYTVNGGTGPYQFTLTTGTTGITITADGTINIASSVVAGTYYETITVTDTAGATAELPLTITVNAGIAITGGSDETTTFGRADSTSAFTITGGTGSYIYALTGGATGISYDASESRIVIAASTPVGTYDVTLTVTDERGDSATITVRIIVNQAVAFGTVDLLQSTLGRAWTFPIVNIAGGTGA